MTKLSIAILKPIVFAALIAIAFSSCTMVDNKDQKALSFGTCEGCHTDLDHLKLVYSPDTAAPAGGCGGTAPHYEPYERVYMGGSGYEAFKGSVHDMACTKCHDGVDYQSDKDKAHVGMLKHPSTEYEERCGKCHTEATNFSKNLHNGIGQKRKVTIRSGLSGHDKFADLPEHKIEGYTANCATCHGTCGNCHIVRPPLAGGGLAMGHKFIEQPDMISTCVSCHTSRGGHAYLGVGVNMDEDIVPDVHLTHPDAKFKCMDCHTGEEIHSTNLTGAGPEHRYEYSELPTCAKCHEDEINDIENGYHFAHKNTFNCQVCHSQDYNSCGSCHVHGEGARQESYLDFKIAQNPLLLNGGQPDANHDFDLALVRRTLGAPDNWDVYLPGEDYSNFDAFPIFNYTTPHNIKEVTKRTVEGVDTYPGCTVNCHIRNEGGNLINEELYLFSADLILDWQISSTDAITMDGELPSGWFVDSSK